MHFLPGITQDASSRAILAFYDTGPATRNTRKSELSGICHTNLILLVVTSTSERKTLPVFVSVIESDVFQ